MYISNQKIAFNYLGSKYSILPWLLPMLPECNHYVSVFGGSAADLINRDPSPIETFNDLNHLVVNFFKVLREHPDQIIQQLELTPHSKHEYDQAWDSKYDTPIEKARKFYIRTQQSIFAAGGQDKMKGWSASIKQSRVSISEATNRWIRSISNLYEVAERLKGVQIECRDFRFILKYYDDPGTLFYCDPPYTAEHRSNSKYTFEFRNQDHIDLHYWASRAKGKVAISGYHTPFMCELFKDFQKEKTTDQPNKHSNACGQIIKPCQPL